MQQDAQKGVEGAEQSASQSASQDAAAAADHPIKERAPENAPLDGAQTVPEGEVAPDEGVVEGAVEVAADLGASAFERLFGVDALNEKLSSFLDWFQSQMLSVDVAVQAGILFMAVLPAAIFGPHLRKLVQSQVAPRAPYGVLRRGASAFAHLATPIALYLILQLAVLILGTAGVSTAIVAAGVSLLTAWIVIRLVSLVIRSPFWSKVAFYVAWPIAALDAFSILDDVVVQLQAFSMPIGEDENGNVQRFSALDLIRTIFVFGVLFWGANFANNFIKGRINAIDELTVSFKALLAKILNVLLPVVALVAALQIVGFPFGTLAIFGGAVGLGIGLGMQRTVSNFFAGFTLIADRSIKPGDVIEVGDTYGWVTDMSARYVSVRTRDGTAHLVPNDIFINEGVTNWSHSDRVVRLHAPFGVSYGTKDLRGLARRAEETALGIDRVLKTPGPRCNLMEFGDSSINFDLRFWINDPANGSSNVRSDVMMALWDLFAEIGVQAPFPQRDLHIKSAPDGFTMTLQDGEGQTLSQRREGASAAK